jgi:hypothetical protein
MWVKIGKRMMYAKFLSPSNCMHLSSSVFGPTVTVILLRPLKHSLLTTFLPFVELKERVILRGWCLT